MPVVVIIIINCILSSAFKISFSKRCSQNKQYTEIFFLKSIKVNKNVNNNKSKKSQHHDRIVCSWIQCTWNCYCNLHLCDWTLEGRLSSQFPLASPCTCCTRVRVKRTPLCRDTAGKRTALRLYYRECVSESRALIGVLWWMCAGINDQGLYRVVGVSSRVQKLLSLMIGKLHSHTNYNRVCIYSYNSIPRLGVMCTQYSNDMNITSMLATIS